MNNYRIVSRKREYRIIDYAADPSRIGTLIPIDFYFAQRKIFNKFWIDCRFIDFTDDFDDSYSPELKIVQQYIDRKLIGKYTPLAEPAEVSKVTDFRLLCKQLVDDLDAWMEYDGQPSKLQEEYKDSLVLIRKVRKILEETK